MLINHDSIVSYITILMSFLSGASINLEQFKDDKKAYATQINSAREWNLDDPNLPENSVAVIPVQGVITTWKSMQIECMVKQANDNPNIIAILFITNSPGGMVVYTDILANTIKNSSIPVVDYIIGMEASAALWAMSGADLRICSSPLDYVGSIGVMMNYMDFTRMLKEKFMIDIESFYARKSTRKNEVARALADVNKPLDERSAGLLDDLDFTNDYFHQAIQSNLSIDAGSEVFSGAIYYAQKSIDLGLANEINPSVEYALEQAFALGMKSKINTIINQNN